MQMRSTLVLALVAGGTSIAAEPVPVALQAPTHGCGVACSHTAAMNQAQVAGLDLIKAQTFWSLRPEDRAEVAKALEARGERIPMLTRGADAVHPKQAELMVPLTADEFEVAFEKIERFTDRETFASFTPLQQRMVSNFAEMATGPDWMPVAPCFTPGTPFEYIELFDSIVSYGLSNGTSIQFEQTDRWLGTALDPSGGGQGNPTILTYSFPPDGTTVPSGVGEPQGPNDLNAFMDGIYGNRATWRGLYDQIFATWASLCGNTYILEPNDDGQTLFNFPGVSGVRGDLRMAGKFIDGNSGTLAYNFFPQNGDMVVDTGDNFYFGTGSNSLRLRNILLHEHGHGMGQLHTCPVTNSKLMEPFINLNFDGPQFDDILNAQRHYGDPNEPNDGSGPATNLGSFGIDSSTTVDNVSLDDDLDTDWYEFTINQTSEVTARLRPQGFLYQAGPQTNNCNEQQPYNPLLFLNPGVEIIAGNGFNVLASANSFGAGEIETASASLDAGTYFVRAFGGDRSGDEIIAYELDLDVDFDALTISQIDPLPTELEPGVGTSFNINISPDGENLIGTPVVSFRTSSSGAFTTANLTNVGGTVWRVDLPAFECADSPEYRIQATGDVDGTKFFPATSTQSAIVGEFVASFDDNGQVDLGYAVTGNAGDGQWELGVPVNNDRGDPPADFDGSGSCWLTDNTTATDNSDVDDGETVLTSPALDLVSGSTVSYAYWFNDIAGGPINGDSFRVQVSTNGGSSYTTVRTVTTAQGVWRTESLVEGVDYTGAAAGQGRLRFIANDIGTQNVVEAGVDAIVVRAPECEDPVVDSCNAADIAEPFQILDLADTDAFINAFLTSGADADIAPPFGVLDLSDVDAFIAAFLAGCP
ncbi:MAG: matrixin family metalloprotease [Planctomycetota bacterium]